MQGLYEHMFRTSVSLTKARPALTVWWNTNFFSSVKLITRVPLQYIFVIVPSVRMVLLDLCLWKSFCSDAVCKNK